MMVPFSTQCLLIAITLTSFQVFTHEIPKSLIWGVFIYGVLVLLGQRISFHARLDAPPPRFYPLSREQVWAAIDEVLRTFDYSKQVSVMINYNNSEPALGEPIFVQATFSIHHPNLSEETIRKNLDPEHQDLKSRIVLRAYTDSAKNMPGRASMILCWQVTPILTRFVEDAVISEFTQRVHQLLAAKKPGL